MERTSSGGTPTWAVVFLVCSLLSEFLIELISVYIEGLLGEGSLKLVLSVVTGLIVLGLLTWLARRRTS